MKPFMDNDFCLKTATARHLYHTYAERMPILDYHCHLSAQEICEDREPRNLSELWLQYDHYKWRQMRANGIAETFITGTAPDKEKFLAFAQTMPYMIGNPLYHWSHLELFSYHNSAYTGDGGGNLGADAGNDRQGRLQSEGADPKVQCLRDRNDRRAGR